jgi:hypothetical protein
MNFLLLSMSLECNPTSSLSLPVSFGNVMKIHDVNFCIILNPKFGHCITYISTSI